MRVAMMVMPPTLSPLPCLRLLAPRDEQPSRWSSSDQADLTTTWMLVDLLRHSKIEIIWQTVNLVMPDEPVEMVQ